MQRTTPTSNHKIQIFFFTTALLFIAFGIIGAIRRYSPIPLADMWDGYLGWYLNSNGKWYDIFALHNEHRIVLARIIFWLNVVLFKNTAGFLIAINYVLVACSCMVFGLLLRAQVTKPQHHYPARIVFLFLVAWLFAWSQRENLVSAFQNQFFTAQLLPLCAFYFLYKATHEARSTVKFMMSCFFGVLSCGTMANGVLALPMMVVYAFFTRQSWQRILILFVLSGGMLFLYFYGFSQPQHHSSLTQSLLETPLRVFHYSLIYLGGCFANLPHQIDITSMFVIGVFAGLLLFLNTIYFAVKCMWIVLTTSKPPVQTKLQLALVFFIFFIIATAIVTASGRIIFGLESALTGRYITPPIMAWAALCLLYFPGICSCYQKYGNKVWIPFIIILLFMLPDEWTALKDKSPINFKRQIAALALELHVKDEEKIKEVFSMDKAFNRIEAADKKQFTISGMEKVKGMRARINQMNTANLLPHNYLGQIETAIPLANDPRFLRVRGWMVDKKTGTVPPYIQFLDHNHRIVGFALTGEPRSDLAKNIKRKAGFEGYVLSDSPWQQLLAVPVFFKVELQ